MRSAWSSFATSSSTPSSTPLRPSFQLCATRIEYCSIVSGLVVGTISTATWLPFFASKAASRPSSALFCCALRVPVRSVTRAASGGTATSARAAGSHSTSASSAARLRIISILCRRLAREIDLRRHGERLLVLDREVGFGVIAEHLRGQVGREFARQHVVLLHCLDIAPARHRDAILGALELGLQLAELLGGRELRIVLRYRQQPGQRAAEARLRRLEGLERLGIVHQLGRRLD